MDFPAQVGVGIGAFVATNVDDLLFLMIFFANRRFPVSQIVLGQYIGMGLLIAVSLLGLLIALVVPSNLIGLVGLFPIAIGIKELLELRKNNENDKNDEELHRLHLRGKKILAYTFSLTVAAVTFSGGEEIGIYASLFATNNEFGEIITLVAVSMALTGIWCGIANYLVYHSFLADHFRRISKNILPFVLIGLGIYILTDAFLLQSLI